MDTDNSEWASEPIAVIGMSCKFSGGASNPDKLWDLMASGKTGWSEIPKERYNLEGVYHANHERNSTVCTHPWHNWHTITSLTTGPRHTSRADTFLTTM